MHRFYLFGTSIFIGLFLGLNPSSISFAIEKNAASYDNFRCPAVLLKNQEYFPSLIKTIDEAESEIMMSFFLFKAGVNKNGYPDRVLAHLAKSAQKGVRVVVILENSGGRDRKLDLENRRTKKLLEAKGVEVYFDSPRRTMHNKLIVVDQRFVLLGSHNLTQAALKYNNEMSILIDRPELARQARTYMLTIIKEAK